MMPPTGAAVLSATVAMVSCQLGAAFAKQLIPVLGAPGRRLSTKVFGTLMSFEPAIAAMAGVVLLHERLTVMQWTAIAAIVVASVGAVKGERPELLTERADFAP